MRFARVPAFVDPLDREGIEECLDRFLERDARFKKVDLGLFLVPTRIPLFP